MRINELITESQQLDEGPLANKIGSAVGKGVGTLAKGVGAVAGGVAGLGAAVKKGFAAGKKTVAGAGDDEGGAADAQAAQGKMIKQHPQVEQQAQQLRAEPLLTQEQHPQAVRSQVL